MKVVFFDYWTKGIHNFTLINDRLISKGNKTMLFHIGSFNDPQHPKEELIKGILCRDISYYNTTILYKALKKIHPDVIISLNTTYILDRALVLACRKLGIKTIFMMHGDRPIGGEIDIMIKSIPYSFIRKIKKASKYLSVVFPNYLVSSWQYNKLSIFNFKPLKVLWLTFQNPSKCNFFPPESDEIIHNKCLIYANKYFEYYLKIGYHKNEIIVVGNPKNEYLFSLIKNGFQIDLIKNEKVRDIITSGANFALYLEDSFQEQGMAEWTYDYLSTHLSDISDRLGQENINLVVKLHPTTDVSKIPNKNNKIIFTESDLEPLIYYCSFCIAHISSTVNLAILLNKPILIPVWAKSKDLPDYYAKHKVANYWKKIDEHLNLNIDESARESYIKENITITAPISINLIEKEIYNI